MRIGVPLAGVPGDVIYLATQDDADVLELYRVSTDTPGVSTKLNPPINKAAEAIESLRSDFFAGGAVSRGKVFYTLRTIATGTLDVYVVDLDNPGVATQVNPDLGDGREVGTDSVMAAGRIYTVELDDPGPATQVSPHPAEGGIGVSMAAVFMAYTDDGATIVYNSPLDDPDAFELYATPVDAPMTATKLSAPLTDMSPEPNGLVSAFLVNHNRTRVAYGEGQGGTSLVHVVDLVAPGVSVQPFGLTADQVFPFPGAIFSHESNLVASFVASADPVTGIPGSSEMIAAISGVADSGIIVNVPLVAGSAGIGPFFWIPETPVTHVLTITDAGVDATQLRVWVGERVEVVNSSSQPHWLRSNPHPIHTDCPSLDQLGQLEPGERGFTDALTQERTCGFHDHLNPTVLTLQGEVIVGNAQGGSGDGGAGGRWRRRGQSVRLAQAVAVRGRRDVADVWAPVRCVKC